MVFSVIIPTRNRASLLPVAIESVLSQSFSHWELIIVDDCSDDNTREIVQPYLSERIKYIRNARPLGPGASRNAGIKSANPESAFVSLLDDDDRYFKDFLQRTYDALQKASGDIGFSWTGIENFYPESNRLTTFFWNPSFRNKEEAFQGFLRNRMIGTGYGVTFKKCVFENVGYFDESLKAVEDTDFFLRVLKFYYYKTIPDTLVRITRQSHNHVNTDSRERAEALEIIYAKHRDAIQLDVTSWYNFKAKISSIYFRLGDKDNGRKVLINALRERIHPRILWLWMRLEIL